MACVAFNEFKDIFHQLWQAAYNLSRVDYVTFIDAPEAAGSNIRVGKCRSAVASEKKKSANRWDFKILMNSSNLQGFEITPPQFADGSETLGSRSEVDCFRVLSRQRLFIKGTAADEALYFLSC
jgi:hypothetical protein